MVLFFSFLVIASAIAAAFLVVNRPQYVRIDSSLPAEFPARGFSHEAFESLLRTYVDDHGNVDYAAWHANARDRDTLDGYLAAVAAYSPDSTPQRFPLRSDQLAYWIYGYNAWVLRTVLQHWPIDSVTDLKAPIEAVKGLGFFYRLRFLFGGASLSLYAVEHDKILGRFADPRVHFVLNCASESCPPMRPELASGAELESVLEEQATKFINDSRNVFIDHENRQIRLSAIFKWYRKDFINDLRRRGLAPDAALLDYVRLYLGEQAKQALDLAGDYEIVFSDYDWALNQAESDA